MFVDVYIMFMWNKKFNKLHEFYFEKIILQFQLLRILK